MNPTNYINTQHFVQHLSHHFQHTHTHIWCWHVCAQMMANIVKKHLHSGEVCSPQLTAVFDISVAGDGRHCEETPAFWWSVFTSVGPALPYVRQCHLWDGQGVFRFPAVPAGGTPLQVVVSVLKCLSQRPSDAYLWLRDLDLTCAER